MNKLLTAITLGLTLCTASIATAQTTTPTVDCSAIDITKYDTTQLESVKQLCRAQETANATVTPDKVREWASLGKEFSVAVTETAKGLGVAVNEFLFTPVGALLAFYFLWDMIGGIIVGSILLVSVWILFAWFMRRIFSENTTVEYTYNPILWGAFSMKQVSKKTTNKLSDDSWGYVTVLALGALALSALITGVLIF